MLPSHFAVPVLGPDHGAGVVVVGHLAGLVEFHLIGVTALVCVPVVVTVSPGQL